MVMELLLKDWREYLCDCLLHKAVNYCWYSKVSCSATWFGYLHPSDWLRFILPCPQLFPDVFAVFRKVCAKLFYGHPVYACRSFVSDDLQIRRIEVIIA